MTNRETEYFIKSVMTKNGHAIKLVRLGKTLASSLVVYVDGISVAGFVNQKQANEYIKRLVEIY